MTKREALPNINLSQSTRRMMVAGQWLLMLVVLGLMLLSPVQSYIQNVGVWGLVAIVVLMFGLMALHTTLAISIGNICQGRRERLDEREQAMRDRAFVTSLQRITLGISLLWVYAMLAWIFGWWLPQPQQFWLVLWAIAMQIYGMPTSLVAWQMPEIKE